MAAWLPLRPLLGTDKERRALTAPCYQASVACLDRIVRHLSANSRIRIRSDILPTNVIHIVGARERALLLNRSGLWGLGACPLRGPIFGLRKDRSGDKGNQRDSRKQLLHGVVS